MVLYTARARTATVVVGFVLVLVALAVFGRARGQAPETPDLEAVQLIFTENCIRCHGGESPTLGLDLSSLAGVLEGSVRGPVVVPGDPETSELILRVRGDSQPRMPLTGPPWLSDEQIALLTAWVASGADPGEAAATTP